MVTGSSIPSLAVLALTVGCFASSLPYREAMPGYRFDFPKDHFEHNDFRTEWWYYSGNVTDSAGSRFGFELVFFRNAEAIQTTSKSVWDPTQLYLAHAALTDAKGGRFRYEERLNRGGPGIAGADFLKGKIWNGNWWARWNGEQQTLHAFTPEFQFDLRLQPTKPFVIQGENGVSQKSEGAGHASYYISFPRLVTSGEIVLGGKKHQVMGTAWMDHEWFTNQLGADQAGWDWFSVQLDNNTELMLFELRRKDGTIDNYSFGAFVSSDGQSHHLSSREFRLTPGKKFGPYPVEWRVQIPSLQMDLKCKAILPDQELKAKQAGPSYWEGAVDFSGTQKGVGYLEMTGYSGALRM